MNKISLTLFCLLIVAVSTLIDPLAYRSFTAPKHALLIGSIPLIGILVFLRAEKLRIGIIPILIGGRILWLASTNPDWMLHPGNDSFYLHLSLLLITVIVQQFEKKTTTKALYLSIFIVGIIQVGIGSWQLLSYVPISTIPIKTAFIGTLGTPNGVGILIVLSIFAGAYGAYRTKTRWIYILYTSGIALLTAGLIASESRGAWLALLGVLVMSALVYVIQNKKMAFFSKKYSNRVVISFTIVVFVALVSSLYVMNPESSKGRLMIWEITTEMINDYPIIGVGQGNYSVEYLHYQAEYFLEPEYEDWEDKAANIKQAHNEFLQAFAEGGITGGILFSIIWLLPLWYFIKKYNESKKLAMDQVTSFAIICAILIHSLVDAPLHVLPVAIIGYCFLGVLEQPTIDIKISVIGRWIGMSMLILFTAFILYRIVQNYPANHHWKRGVSLASNQEWGAAALNYQQSLDRLGQKGELSYQLGSALILDGQYSKGIYHLNEAKRDFNDKNIYLSESLAYIKLKNYEKAKELAEQALAMFPSHLAPHLLLGEIYYELGEVEKSKASLMKCINEDISIKSPETNQISIDAMNYWNARYGEFPIVK